ncbi:MAG: type II toxin-antitoxin system RelE/ParE family toxin [Chitinophagaceae bacterium]|nr:type II toxin-antitoxin system RelE/ParE family toxin [Chitinophagaceae bacterium]
MSYKIEISPEAAKDIDSAFEYYNNASPGLGFKFVDMLDDYFELITKLPTSSAIRYDDIRVKPVSVFPFTIHYTIKESGKKVIVVRVFHTSLKPFW